MGELETEFDLIFGCMFRRDCLEVRSKKTAGGPKLVRGKFDRRKRFHLFSFLTRKLVRMMAPEP